MARPENTNAVTHGLGSKVVQEYRRLNRLYRADTNNMDKLEAVEDARWSAVEYVRSLLLQGIKNPNAKIMAFDFVIQQGQQCVRRTRNKSHLKGNRWAF